MGSLERRLGYLEEQMDAQETTSEEQKKERWLREARFRRREALEERDADHARSLIELYRVQNILTGMGTDELIDRILSWGPVPDGGRSRTIVEREVGLAIHNQEPDTEDMACPPAWSESFAAGDELRERYFLASDEVLAEGYARLKLIEGEDEEELARWTARYEEPFGITEELTTKAVGPDFAEITEEEQQRRISGYLADACFGEKGYRMWRHVERIEKELGLEAPTGGRDWGY